MHELSVALELLRLCREEQARAGAGPPVRVDVAVGELSGVEPDLLLHAWEAAVAEGPEDGARLEIRRCRARQRCELCGDVEERQPGSWLRLCPVCAQPLRIEGGAELDLLRLEFLETADLELER